MLKFLKNWTLPIAMLVGAVGYPVFISFSFLTPILIFTMLLLTFCKVSPRDLKPKPLHLWLLLIQIFGSLIVYLLLYRFNKIVAEGAMVCDSQYWSCNCCSDPVSIDRGQSRY